MGGNTKIGLAALSVFIAVFATNAAAQSEREIGVTAAVNPQAEGIPQSAESRTLQVGVNVLANERIVTSDGGQAQMLFLDESAFTVGPNSDVVLDEFVFDPDTGTGRIALTAAKGVFRMVGGKISKRTPVTLKTPTAVIGIRGGIALVNVAPNGATQATFLFGDQMTVGTSGGVRSVTRPGFTVSANTADAAPSNPTRASATQLNAALGGLEGSAPPPADGGDGDGQAAGGGQVPTDQDVADSGIGELGSGNNPDALAGPGPAPSGPGGGGEGGGAGAGAGAGRDATQQAQQIMRFRIATILVLAFLAISLGASPMRRGSPGSTSSTATFGLDLDVANNDNPFSIGSVAGGIFSADLGTTSLGVFKAPLAAGHQHRRDRNQSPVR